MKKVYILFVMLISFASCSKDEASIPGKSAESFKGDLITAAKEWYNKNKPTNGEIKSFYLNQYSPDWSKIQKLTNFEGREMLSIPLIPNDADDNFRILTEMTVTFDNNGEPFGVIREYFGNPYKNNTLFNMYNADGSLLVSGEYNPSAKGLQKITKMSASANGGTSCSISPEGGTSGSSNNPGPCNDDGSDPDTYPGQPLKEVVITDTYPGGPKSPLPEFIIPFPSIPVTPGGGGGAPNPGMPSNSDIVNILTEEQEQALFNKLCSKSFNFVNTVPADGKFPGWKEASLQGLTVETMSDSYFESIWTTVTTGTPIVRSVFNLEIGLPGDLPAGPMAVEAAKAANEAMRYLLKTYSFKAIKRFMEYGTFPTILARQIQANLTGVYGRQVLVSTQLSGRTKPGTPVKGADCM